MGKHSKLLISFVIALVPSLVGASLNPNPPRTPANPINTSSELPAVDCKNVVNELARLRSMAQEHHQSVGAFVDEISVVMGKWYEQLVPLEGKPLTISAGTFSPLKTGAAEVGNVQAMVYENANFIDARMGDILDVLPKCLK